MKKTAPLFGHLMALFVITVWSNTFIVSKVLLRSFQPIELIFFRFVLGFLALLLANPKRLTGTTKKQELMMAAAGLTGVALYYLLENFALTFTLASNVGIVLSAAPFFIAVLGMMLPGEKERPGAGFFLGFAFAMAGIVLISLVSSSLDLNPLGNILPLLAACSWAVYSQITKRIATWGYNLLLTTRRIMGYGLLWMLPVLPFSGFRLGAERFLQPVNLLCILFLGLIATALCFSLWNYVVGALGPVTSSVYMYLSPGITFVSSVLILREPVTVQALAGMGLILLGLVISQKKKGQPA